MTQTQVDALEWINQMQSEFADMQVEVSAEGLRPPAHVVLSIDVGAFKDPQEKCLTCGQLTFLRLTTFGEPLPLCIDHAEESVRLWHTHLQALDFAASMRELGAHATVEVVSIIDGLPSGDAKHLRHLRAQMDETRQWQHTSRDNFEATLLRAVTEGATYAALADALGMTISAISQRIVRYADRSGIDRPGSGNWRKR